MKCTWMGMIMAGAVFSSGCASIAGAALDLAGARSASASRTGGPGFTQASAFGGAGSGSASGLAGARPGAGDAMAYQRGPVITVDGGDYHSLADAVSRRPSVTSPVGMATRRAPMLGPEDSPLVEWGILGFGVKGLPGADIRRLGVSGYAKSWAQDGLGRSVAEISHDPSTIFTYVQFRVFSGGERRMLLY